MAGIGLIGAIGQGLIAGSQGYRDRLEFNKQEALKEDLRKQSAEDRSRRMEREDYQFNAIKDQDAAEANYRIGRLNEMLDPKHPEDEYLNGINLEAPPEQAQAPDPATPGALGTLPPISGQANGQDGLPSMPSTLPQAWRKTGDLSKMTLSYATDADALAQEGRVVAAKVKAERERVRADVQAILANTTDNPTARKNQLSAYSKMLDADKKFAATEQEFQDFGTKVNHHRAAQATFEAIRALMRGDSRTMVALGFVNEDGSPMEAVRDNAGRIIGLQSAIGVVGQNALIQYAGLVNGTSTWKEFADAVAKDTDFYKSQYGQLQQNERAQMRISVNAGGGTPNRSLEFARERTAVQARMRGIKKGTKEWDALYDANLREQDKLTGERLEDQGEGRSNALAQKAVQNFISTAVKGKGKSLPTLAGLISTYKHIRDVYSPVDAERYIHEVTTSWTKQGDALRDQFYAAMKNEKKRVDVGPEL